MLDWDVLREALQAALLRAVSAEAGGPWRAAALDEQYAETDGVITAPSLYLNDDGELSCSQSTVKDKYFR